MFTMTMQIPLERSEEAVNFYQLIFNAVVVHRVPLIIERNFSAVIGQRVYLTIDGEIFEVVTVDSHMQQAQLSYIFPTRYVENVNIVAALLYDNPEIEVFEDRTFGNVRVCTFRDPFGFCWRVASNKLRPVLNLLPAP